MNLLNVNSSTPKSSPPPSPVRALIKEDTSGNLVFNPIYDSDEHKDIHGENTLEIGRLFIEEKKAPPPVSLIPNSGLLELKDSEIIITEADIGLGGGKSKKSESFDGTEPVALQSEIDDETSDLDKTGGNFEALTMRREGSANISEIIIDDSYNRVLNNTETLIGRSISFDSPSLEESKNLDKQPMVHHNRNSYESFSQHSNVNYNEDSPLLPKENVGYSKYNLACTALAGIVVGVLVGGVVVYYLLPREVSSNTDSQLLSSVKSYFTEFGNFVHNCSSNLSCSVPQLPNSIQGYLPSSWNDTVTIVNDSFATITSLTEQNQGLYSVIDQLNTTVIEQGVEIASLSSNITQLTNENHILNNTVKILNYTVNEQNIEISNLTALYNNVSTQLASLTSLVGGSKSWLNSLSSGVINYASGATNNFPNVTTAAIDLFSSSATAASDAIKQVADIARGVGAHDIIKNATNALRRYA